jgi:tetratricopeptide (TPR) repeat protein
MRDRRLIERTFADIHALMEGHDFATIEEANAFLEAHIIGTVPPRREPRTDLDRAQQLFWDALEATTSRQRAKMARQALEISPDCADAYVLLAEEEAEGPEEALELYEQGMAAGERVLGPEAFTELRGKFWGHHATRPYMRARAGVALCLWDLGRREEAVDHLLAVLDLNPDDNQGVRDILAIWLLELGRTKDLGGLLKRYSDDGSLEMLWARAIWTFRTRGPGVTARRRLREAFERNPHVLALLLRAEKLPNGPSELVAYGGVDEAAHLLMGLLPALDAAGETVDWVMDEIRALLEEVPDPDDPKPVDIGPKKPRRFIRERRH